MKRMGKLHGVFVPLITPLFDETTVDLTGVKRLAENMLSSPSVNGLFGLGATGEFVKLSYEERKAVIEVLGNIPKRRKPIIVNTGGLPMDQILTLSEFALGKGINAVAIVVPDEVAYESNAVFTYLEPVNKAGFPFMLYWSPSYSKHRSDVELTDKLLQVSTFVGIKDASRDMVVFTDLCTRYGKEISIFQGVEMLHLCSLAVGSVGVVGGGLNLYPRLLAEITEAFETGNLAHARALQQQVNMRWETLNAQTAFRSVCKQYWKKRGLLQGVYCRVGNNIAIGSQAFYHYEQLVAI